VNGSYKHTNSISYYLAILNSKEPKKRFTSNIHNAEKQIKA